MRSWSTLHPWSSTCRPPSLLFSTCRRVAPHSNSMLGLYTCRCSRAIRVFWPTRSRSSCSIRRPSAVNCRGASHSCLPQNNPQSTPAATKGVAVPGAAVRRVHHQRVRRRRAIPIAHRASRAFTQCTCIVAPRRHQGRTRNAAPGRSTCAFNVALLLIRSVAQAFSCINGMGWKVAARRIHTALGRCASQTVEHSAVSSVCDVCGGFECGK